MNTLEIVVNVENLSQFVSLVAKHAKRGTLDSYSMKDGKLQIWAKSPDESLEMWVDGEWL
jgi:hypothetical protein